LTTFRSGTGAIRTKGNATCRWHCWPSAVQGPGDRLALLRRTQYAARGRAARCGHAAELNVLFGQWFAEHDLQEILQRFEQHGGTLAPIYSAQQIVEDAQVQARGFLRQVPDADFGSVRMADVVPRFRNDPGSVDSVGGAIGQDNDEVFGEWLGLTASDCGALRDKGVI
jgi:crotonobetainyl-CoA:carnitine CoA-transferase CaiB-like acyl-CoA transferase